MQQNDRSRTYMASLHTNDQRIFQSMHRQPDEPNPVWSWGNHPHPHQIKEYVLMLHETPNPLRSVMSLLESAAEIICLYRLNNSEKKIKLSQYHFQSDNFCAVCRQKFLGKRLFQTKIAQKRQLAIRRRAVHREDNLFRGTFKDRPS